MLTAIQSSWGIYPIFELVLWHPYKSKALPGQYITKIPYLHIQVVLHSSLMNTNKASL